MGLETVKKKKKKKKKKKTIMQIDFILRLFPWSICLNLQKLTYFSFEGLSIAYRSILDFMNPVILQLYKLASM